MRENRLMLTDSITQKVFKGTFDRKAYEQLEKTNAVAVIGDKANVINAINSFNPDQAKVLASDGFGRNGVDGKVDPEDSQNPRHTPTGGSDDNIISIATGPASSFGTSTKTNLEDGAAFLINHGAGHLSNLEHARGLNDHVYDDDGNSVPVYVPNSPNVMTSGPEIVNDIQKGAGTLQGHIASPINQQPANAKEHTLSIKASYIQRFGNNTPNATLPTYQR
jgi:hypothetical protein